jgi:thiamine pyrophosphate-dependent acetolactate synthase large subunit-like protein
MTSHATKGSDILVRALENEGVEYVFGVPGEENLDMLESLRTSCIKVVVTRHEQVAGFMAATYGRLTGKPGVCLSTLGPGATNLVTAAAHASLGGMPMLMITGQKPVLQSRQAQFQIIDTVSMMRPLTKSAKQVIDAGNIPTLVRDAFRVAEAERPGPVHLELPEDIAVQLTESVVVPVSAAFRPVAAQEAIARASAAIAAARHPLVMIGGGANRPGLAPALSAAMRRLKLPFFNTQMGKGAVDGNSELFVGTAALSEGDYVHRAIERADLIVTVGHDTAEKPPPPPTPPPVPQAPAPAPPPAIDPGLVLAGVIITADVKKAYLVNKADSQGIWASEGESIMGWTVQSIDAESAKLLQANRTLDLRLYRQSLSRSRRPEAMGLDWGSRFRGKHGSRFASAAAGVARGYQCRVRLEDYLRRAWPPAVRSACSARRRYAAAIFSISRFVSASVICSA